MTDRTIDQVLAGCAKYWASTGVPPDAIAEMRAELQTLEQRRRLEERRVASAPSLVKPRDESRELRRRMDGRQSTRI